MMEPVGRSNRQQRTLYVATQIAGRSIHPVGRLTVTSPPSARHTYEFIYLQGALTEGFEPFLAFPDLHGTYTSQRLFPFFSNRLMSSRRADYGLHLRGLRLDKGADDFEVLARSGGQRATDRVELFEAPERDKGGYATCEFFARGLRYVEGAFEEADGLSNGDKLRLLPEPVDTDPTAVAIVGASGQRFGYVPRYASSFVTDALDRCPPETVELTVKHVSDSKLGHHVRLLLQFRCCWLETDWPFNQEAFQPIATQPAA